ncbi:MAG: hypothetical protein A2Y25_02865 [Candidatus Melainabacteria bacterium GWF2_37_15]|nr:MAG: hypothetical protein A2Y25_02865 [Candidatus Melainabacteria bacterium GWF2_37_15]
MKPDGVGKPEKVQGWQSEVNPAGKTKGKGFLERNKHYNAFIAEQNQFPPLAEGEETPPQEGLDVQA